MQFCIFYHNFKLNVFTAVFATRAINLAKNIMEKENIYTEYILKNIFKIKLNLDLYCENKI